MSAVASTVAAVPSSVPSTLLRGHTAQVLSLALGHAGTATDSLLLSGSEDASARVWDTRTGRSTRCIKSFGGAAVTSVAFDPHREFELLLSADRTVHRVDLRATRDIIVRESTHAYTHNKDEINAISVNAQGTFVAAADDECEVKVIDLNTGREGQLFKTLRGRHTNLCTSVLFRPKSTWELWSGGMDCQILQWDFSSGRQVNAFSSQASVAAASASQTLNPPFVNSMAFTRDGEYLVAGSGNAEILLFDAKRKTERRRVTGHTHSVMHVGLFSLPPSFSSLSAFSSSTCLLSAGNDQTLLLWDLQALIDTPAPTAAASVVAAATGNTAKNRKKKEKARAKKKAAGGKTEDAEESTEGVEEVAALSIGDTTSPAAAPTGALLSSPALPASLAFSELESAALDTGFIRYRWKHHAKMNSLVSAAAPIATNATGEDATNAATAIADAVNIFVADTTNHITAYHLR